MPFEMLPTLPVILFIIAGFAFFMVRERLMKRRTNELIKQVTERNRTAG
jgi:hypothetical protein